MSSLSNYTTGPLLHEGPGTVVHRGQRADGLPVVLKFLRGVHPSPEAIGALRHEFDTQRMFDGPHVAAAIALATDQRRWALVTEDFGAVPLSEVIARGELDLAGRLELAVEIAEAVGEVHAGGVVHKDVNPSNIVLNEETGALKLIDFGISTSLSTETPQFSNLPPLTGTLRYISPEQTGRVSATVDHRTDLYSLGVTLYELFTGQVPFDNADSLELVHAHIARRPLSPRERLPTLPAPISDIVMRLLEKSVDDRYQSTVGLRADLATALSAWRETGAVDAFPLGARDRSERFQIPARLYGRDDAISTLLTALEGSPEGRVQRSRAVVVTGSAGLGKSALVQEIYAPLTERRGTFIRGKFDQFSTTPYAGFVSAFRSLVRELLGESSSRLERLREELRRALGPNGAVVTQVIPQVQLLIGPQPTLTALGPEENSNRFNTVFSNFVRVFAQPNHPLALFLDDLQWADRASLRLLSQLAADERANLLILGAYRDDEVNAGHPLTATLAQLERDDVSLSRVDLGPLNLDNVLCLLCDASGVDAEQARPLAELVLRNTGGNPLFVTEYLRTLARDELLSFDRDMGTWQWDLEQIRERGFTQNVLQLMTRRLQRLPAQTREVVQLAACAGNSFDLSLLAQLRGEEVAAVWNALLPAVAAGVVVTTSELDAKTAQTPDAGRTCRFFHDRLQEGAYELMAPPARAEAHANLGRLLRDRAQAGTHTVSVFDIVAQLNLGRAHLDAEERIALRRLNLTAAHRAIANNAGAAATEHVNICLALLPEDPWEAIYDETLAIYQAAGLAAFLCVDHDRAAQFSQLLLGRVRTRHEKAQVYILAIRQLTAATQYDAALEAMHKGLALYDAPLPGGDPMEAIGVSFGEIQALLAGRSPADLGNNPMMTDQDAMDKVGLLLWAMAPAFYISPLVYTIIIFEALKLAFVHGNPPELQSVYCFYGHLLGAMFGDPEGGFEWSKLSLALTRKSGALQDQCQSAFITSNFSLGWVRHLRDAREINLAGVLAGIHGGEVRFAGYIQVYLALNDLWVGEPLSKIQADTEGYLAFNAKHKSAIAVDCIEAIRAVIHNLIGETDGTTDYDHDGLDEATRLARCEANHSAMAVEYYTILKSMVHTMYREFDLALALSAQAAQDAQVILGNTAVARNVQYRALALAGGIDAGRADSEALRTELGECVAQLEGWASHCEENWGHGHALAAAEAARLAGDTTRAAELYDRAIRLSLAHRYAHDHAVASELAGRFWQSQGRGDMATSHLAQARYGFEQWGARRKAQMLEDEFPFLKDAVDRPRSGLTGTQTATRTGGANLDLATVIKASHAISGEIVLERLLERLMQLVMEAAGAQHGVLLVADGDEFAVRASATLEPAAQGEVLDIDVDLNTSLTSYAGVAPEVVLYAVRTQATLILDDAVDEGSFTQTPYITTHRPRSVMCLPLRNKGALIGALYLENRDIRGAFTEDRLEVLRLLSTQFGISFENARLYNEMEDLVARRTDQLRAKADELEQTLADLRTAQSRLVHAEKMASLGTLTAGVAHEINNPLNFVNNFAAVGVELVEDLAAWRAGTETMEEAEVDELLTDLKANISAIHDHGGRASEIVSSMLEHVRGGGTGDERRPHDLNRLLRESVKLAEFGLRSGSLDDRDIQVVLDLDDSVGSIPLLPQQLTRVIVNLLNNAIDAINERARRETGSFAGRLLLSTRRHGDSVRLVLEDNGCGVPPELQTKVFEPFFTTKSGTEGTGLGLSLCYDIVVQGHSGSIEIEDVEDGGARFVLLLPVGDGPRAPSLRTPAVD